MRRSGGRDPGATADVVCIGEALVLLPDVDAPDLSGALLAGAEANVAAGLAGAGVASAWVGRLGEDPFGAFLHRELRHRGVDVGGVVFDDGHPTGHYAKHVEVGADGEPRTRMQYRRAGSAAAAMDPAFLDAAGVRERLTGARIVHCSGITAALSDSCAELMQVLLGRPRTGSVAFDVNWREQMWPGGDPGLVAELAALADIVLVGGDEASRVFGTDDVAALRRSLPGPELLVVKDGADRAVAVARDGTTVVQPALRVDVVEPVGAGDAFAAGLLTGVVRGDPVPRRLRRGHLTAAAVLTVPGDSAPPPPEGLLDVTEQEWARITVGAAGFDAPVTAAGDR